ncbi:UNVERIFIED_CONTAM: Chlorophyll a-b binding protein 8, chloroplastic [Sesamum calycinum]|uniref:Chlorophyll a-b binding protein, chloroplastic n=1 Tax=Sesamum calycinum TaxID=2727403 RepID=A0AAW2Q449_9LAMI
MATQALVSSSSICSSADAARQILGGRSIHSSRKASFVVKAASTPPVKQGANRQLWFASKQSLSYLDGSLPGDYGFDPLGLSDPEGTGGFIEPRWLAYGEIINGRFAMLGAAGAIAPEILGKAGLIPAETALPWFKTGVIPPAGTYSYWADPYTLFVLEMALMGFAEHRRFQDWANPGSMGKQYFLGLEKGLGGSGDPAYRAARFSTLWGSGLVTGVGPYQNLLDHLADPVHNNVLTSLKFH